MGVDAASRDGPSSADFVGAPDDGREMHADNLVIDAK